MDIVGNFFMEYKIAQNTISMLSRLLRYAAILILFLILCNFLFGLLLWHQSGNEKTILVPTNLTKKSMVSSQGVDANYLLQCAMFFVDTRLDVTPNTIDANNQLILSHTVPQYYAKFKSGLDKEADLIKSQKVSSAFYVSNIQSNPSNLIVIVSGQLRRWVGERALASSQKTYQLHFSLNGSELFLTTFDEIGQSK